MSALGRLGISPMEVDKIQRKYSSKQKQTKQTFEYKWSKRDTYDSDAVKSNHRKWLLERYCQKDPGKISSWLDGGRKIILDAGCGSGFSALLLFEDQLKSHDYLGVDISSAVEIAKQRFAEEGYTGDFLQASLLEIPIPDSSVDLIFSEGVLHHTDSTEKSIQFLASKLKQGGRFLFYVYAKKAIIREFSDDFVRNAIGPMSDQEAWEALKPLTKLGMALGELDVEIDVPEDIPFLRIKKGRQNLQRFFYWNICKLFFRSDYSLEEMNHINFDWYRPQNCHRHTREEVIDFCDEAKLQIEHMNIQNSGITVVARKKTE
jgi:SAM-dependent methyltransferase